jgi:choice-of-anchor C domain-containing protein
MKTRLACITAVLLATAGIAPAQIVVNGSFETGIQPGMYTPIGAIDSTSITGWTVANGDVDYIGGHWTAAEGNRSLDLNGVAAGTVSQTVGGFTPGQAYVLNFWMASNPDDAPLISSLAASVGSTSQAYAFDRTGCDRSNMGWAQNHLYFTATAAALTVSFTSLQDGWGGPALDNVSVAVVPEPGAAGVFALCALVVAWRNTRRRP